MDLIRSLGVAIDPTRAESGGARAQRAFRSVGTSAGQMERNIHSSNRALGESDHAMRRVERSGGGLVGAFRSIKLALAATGVAFFVRDMVQTEMVMQRARAALRYASDGAADFERNYGFARDVVSALGMDLQSTSREFAKFAAAAKGTEFTGDEVRAIFLSVAKASTVLGLSADETSGTLNALQQMISKGTVQAEELRGQLGERLPGAFQLAARAMKVSTKELGKMLETGQVTAHELLPALAVELEKAFGRDVVASTGSLTAEINRLKSAWTDFKDALFNSGVGDFFVGIVRLVRQALDEVTGFFKYLKESGGSLMSFAPWNLGGIAQVAAAVGKRQAVGGAMGDPMGTASRAASILAPPTPKQIAFEGGKMAEFRVAPTMLENFRAGIGGGIFEFDKKTGKMENQFSNAMRNMVRAGTEAVQSIESGFDGFFDTMLEGTASVGRAFKDMARSILLDIAKIIAKQAIINPIVGALGSAIGITPTIPTPVSHTGATVGVTAGLSRLVNPLLFSGAPRFHNGLAPDEFPAILERGEQVIPRGQSGQQVAAQYSITVNVNGSDSGDTESNRAFGTDIARQLEAMMDARLARALMPRGILSGAR